MNGILEKIKKIFASLTPIKIIIILVILIILGIILFPYIEDILR